MSNFLDIALQHAARGWHVFPLKPKDKKPVISKAAGGKGFYDATLDAEQIKAWWTQYPTANVGIACGASDLYVADCDHGLNSEEDFHAWRMRNNLPVTYTVRTGRRTSYAVQMYFRGAMECNGKWELDGCSGEIRSAGGLVMSVGNIHPDTGESYQLLTDAPLAPRPAIIERAVHQAKVERPPAPGEPLPMLGKGDGRHPLMMAKLGKAHQAGFSEHEAIGILMALNDERFSDHIPLDEIEQTVRSCYAKWESTEPPPVVTIGSKPEEKKITDWRERYHTKDEMDNAPPISFLIDGFLQREGVTGLAAPVRERKSLIALNVAHALLTGEKLFDHFAVVKKPSRVLYLCPEVSLGPFTDRLRKIGLMDYVGETLFCRTLSAHGHVELADLKEELPDSVVILDTAIRFIEGKESDSADIRVFADTNFALLKGGADSVLLLHHSPKDSVGDVMTLENALRGSGDLGAFLCCCWGTKLQDPANPYQSASYLENLKQRDFESQPFEVTCGPDCRLHIVGNRTTQCVELKPRRGKRTNRDGKDEAAIAFLKTHPDLSTRDAARQLKEMGFKGRGKDWVHMKLRELSGTGVRISETP